MNSTNDPSIDLAIWGQPRLVKFRLQYSCRLPFGIYLKAKSQSCWSQKKKNVRAARIPFSTWCPEMKWTILSWISHYMHASGAICDCNKKHELEIMRLYDQCQISSNSSSLDIPGCPPKPHSRRRSSLRICLANACAFADFLVNWNYYPTLNIN